MRLRDCARISWTIGLRQSLAVGRSKVTQYNMGSLSIIQLILAQSLSCILIFGICLAGCTAVPLMKESYFNEVALGTEISHIERIYGEPYEVHLLSDGRQEYSYIQRIELGSSSVEQMEFIFTVDQGKVIGKEHKRHGTSCFQFSN